MEPNRGAQPAVCLFGHYLIPEQIVAGSLQWTGLLPDHVTKQKFLQENNPS